MSDNNNLIKLWGNDDKRKKFVGAYCDWGVWFTTPELGWTWYRYVMPNGDAIIAMEYQHEVFDSYPDNYKLITTPRYYIWRKGKPFTPGCYNSIGAVAELLKGAKVSLMNGSKTKEEQ